MTPYSNLPYSHNALKVFESVARLMSFTKAADELHVTQSAVSRQIKQLEDELNATLVVRKHRAIELTAKGKDLYEVLRKNFHELETLFKRWQKPDKQRIVIKSSLSFATRILLTKVSELNERYPDYEIVIIPSIEENPELSSEDCDLLIINTLNYQRYINHPNVTFMRDEYMAPVYAKSLREDEISLDDVLVLPHLHATLDHLDWKLWFSQAELKGTKVGRDTVFFSLDLALSACLSGQGVTVTDLLLVLPELKRGFLACPEKIILQHSQWKYLCYQGNQSAIISEIYDWLMAQTRSERDQLRQLCDEMNWDYSSVSL
ncbi:LysR family transcriptional regulator [Vibrio sp. SCSIO 43136]|uniref:LysR family transcriptional regulator n=1 Tax=Vibrio sp. SCSIO 43136 TaxID=2819101 RepID=UPI0020765B13|nr:LysR family transcriptional regulator [Vibrio sp. SCSIO 43136]USD67100.1 LysR family transcriptional regulator [Vibrio sp. SCSIO 43136]